MTTIENAERLAEIAQGKQRLASRMAEQQADAASQLRHRQNEVAALEVEIRSGRTEEALDYVEQIQCRCPSVSDIETWARQAGELNGEAERALSELRESLVKLREVESTRVRHGGDPID